MPRQFLRKQAGTTPLRRLGSPEEIAGLAAFLSSADGDYADGEYSRQSLHVNGGLYYA